ncbi:MAG: glycosyltransferase [Holophagales bacterium]|nr:glycosyltransferase [Holophagales bacterium]
MERLPAGVIVVNWNGGALLDSCLDALDGQGAARILVVDNGSEPGELQRLAGRAGVFVLPLGTNRGFSPASNAGAVDARMKALPYVAFVNNDAVLEPGYLAACVAALEADPGLSGVQGVVLDAGGGLVDGLGIGWNRRREAIQLGHGGPPPPADAPPFQVSGVSGTAPVFRRSDFERAGGFAGSFFAWYEDADLALRLLRAGGSLRLRPRRAGPPRGFGHRPPHSRAEVASPAPEPRPDPAAQPDRPGALPDPPASSPPPSGHPGCRLRRRPAAGSTGGGRGRPRTPRDLGGRPGRAPGPPAPAGAARVSTGLARAVTDLPA